MYVWERNKLDLAKGCSCSGNIFSIKIILGKWREVSFETHIAFVDFIKAFDPVIRNWLWAIMEERWYTVHLIETIKNLHKGTKIVINTSTSKTEELTINQGVRQECSMSPSLFKGPHTELEGWTPSRDTTWKGLPVKYVAICRWCGYITK